MRHVRSESAREQRIALYNNNNNNNNNNNGVGQQEGVCDAGGNIIMIPSVKVGSVHIC